MSLRGQTEPPMEVMPLTSEAECVKSLRNRTCGDCPLVKAVADVLGRKKNVVWGPLRRSYREIVGEKDVDYEGCRTSVVDIDSS